MWGIRFECGGFVECILIRSSVDQVLVSQYHSEEVHGRFILKHGRLR